MYLYSLYGMTVASPEPFRTPLSPAVGEADLTFRTVEAAPYPVDWASVEPLCASPHTNEQGESLWRFYQFAECAVVRCPDVGDYYLWSDRICCHLRTLPPATQAHQRYWLEIWFLGTVMAFWLERQGHPVLHAAAVATPQGALAFLADSGSGKSTLATHFVQAGHALLADDNLAVAQAAARFVAAPGYPQIRMWPELATYAVGDYTTLDPLYPTCEKRRLPIGAAGIGTFCSAAQPLAACYIPLRRDPRLDGEGIAFAPLSPTAALCALLHYSFLAQANQRLAGLERRLQFWAHFVKQVPVKYLYYPDGFAYLPQVRQAILADLAQQGGA